MNQLEFYTANEKKDKCISATNDNMVDLAKLQWNISPQVAGESFKGKGRDRAVSQGEGLRSGRDTRGLPDQCPFS